MIDLNPSANDQRVLDAVREEALIARQYARHYDENEHEAEECAGMGTTPP